MVIEEVSPGGVAHKAAKGALALGLRQVATQLMAMAGGIFLSRLLSPGEFGLFAITNFVLGFLVSFAGSGLAANLIRQEAEPDERDYRAMFTFQQALLLVIAIGMWLAAPLIADLYRLPGDNVWVFRAVAVALFLTGFLVIPQVRLERHLAFDRIATVEVTQSLVFNTSAVLLAYFGLGVFSFAIALVARTAVGAVMFGFVHPWRPTLLWDWGRVWRHLAFGLPYQGGALVSTIKDGFTPVFIGLSLGASQVGYVMWALTLAAYPLWAVLVLQRLYMPLISRLQSLEPNKMAGVVEQLIWFTNAVVAPFAVLTLVLVEPITKFVFGEKWLVAIPIFVWIWTANLFIPTMTPVLSFLNGMGRPKVVFVFAVLWMVLTWILGVPLTLLFGPIGFGIATALLQLSKLWLFGVAQTLVPFRVLPAAAPVWLIAVFLGAISFAIALAWPVDDLSELLIFGAVYCMAYALIVRGVLPGRWNELLFAWRGKQ